MEASVGPVRFLAERLGIGECLLHPGETPPNARA